MFRLFRRLLLFVIILVITGGVVYSFTDAFSKRWRNFVIAKFEERGVHLDFERFGLGIADGLVARDVRIFTDAGHKQLLMSMDRLNLDIDYGKLMQKQFFLEGLELSQAEVSLPLDPAEPKMGHLDLTKFSARIFLMDDRLDIRRAEADLAGVHLVISGSLEMPTKTHRVGGVKKDKPKSEMVGLATIREQREHVQHALDWLNRFTFDRRPVVTFDISGDVEMPDELTATLSFHADGVRYEGYVCKELNATAEYHDHLLDIRRVMMRDSIGTFEGSATWPTGSDEVDFRVNTTADLPKLAQSFFQSDELKEVVFYQSSSPSLSLEGKWFISGPKAGPKRPVEALGRLSFGQFTTRGEVFEGLTASFGVNPGGYYIRDAVLRHKTGSLSLQAMAQVVEGFKYKAAIKMDPHAFLPFISVEPMRDLVQRFAFTDSSSILLELNGEGPDATPAACMNRGRVELRDFKYRGIEFDSWSGDVEFFNHKQIFRNVSMVPTQGHAYADEVIVDTDAKTVKLTGVKGKLDPVPLTSCFARIAAESLVKYHFGSDTEINLGGTIGYQTPDATDLNVTFKNPDGTASYNLWQRDHLIRSPSGTIGFKGRQMTFDVKGRVFGGAMKARGHVMLGEGSKGYDVELQAEEFRHQLLGKDLPLENFTLQASAGDSTTPYSINARVLGGTMTLAGMLQGKESFTGELKLSGIGFQNFAKVYAPGNESEGDITGHFKFNGKFGNMRALRGSGVLIILNGNLVAIPVLGPLTPLLGAVLPGPIKGYNVAREANCNFTVADGFVVTEDFEALTTAFKIVANGNLDFINDTIDFTAQARMRGLPGLVLRPVSELFEYKGEGTISKPHWRPHYLSIGQGRQGEERKPPSAMELEETKRRVEAQTIPERREKSAILPLGRQGR